MLNLTQCFVRTGVFALKKTIPTGDKTWSIFKNSNKSSGKRHQFSSSSRRSRLIDYKLENKQEEIEPPVKEGDFTDKSAAEYLNNLSEEDKKRLKMLKLEYEMWQCSDVEVPEEMTDRLWARILFNGDSDIRRKRMYKFFSQTEFNINSIEMNKNDTSEKDVEEETYLLLTPSKMNQIISARVAQAMMFGRPLILDMSFDSYMNDEEEFLLIKQILNGLVFIQQQIEPVYLNFVNFNPQSYIYKKIEYVYRKTERRSIMAKTSEENYLDMFPKKRLVYLTADAQCDLIEDHPDNIYIIGGLMEKSRHQPLSLTKAKKEKIKYARLPNEVLWKMGRKKDLTVDHVINIMATFMYTKDWKRAMTCIEERKIMPNNENQTNELKKKLVYLDNFY